ncbi:hypothetical protein ACFPRL_25405 [Pseudoclavibacter helvolus]
MNRKELRNERQQPGPRRQAEASRRGNHPSPVRGACRLHAARGVSRLLGSCSFRH